jgi:transposase InsO family protein
MPWREASHVSERLEFVELALAEGSNLSELCRRFGVSRPTAYKWLGRRRAGEPLEDRSRRPHASPSRSGHAVEAAVLKVRQAHPAWGARKIRAVLLARKAEPPAVSTVHAILARHGRIAPESSPGHTPWRRFEHERPNVLWQMDFKGHVPLRRGGRCHPLTILDDHSRFSVALRACSNEREVTVRGQLIETFRRFGLPERILTDNGSPWGVALPGPGHTRLTLWLLRLGVAVAHGRPRHPQTQGKCERFHRTLKAELLSRMDLRDLPRAQGAFDRWREEYNLERPHEACGMAPPVSRYSPSPRPYPERLPEVEYGPGDQVRIVADHGDISFAARKWYITEALGGERVAVRPTGKDGIMSVCYGPHALTTIDLSAPRGP